MSKKKPNITSQISSLVQKPINDMGYILWDVTYYKEGAEKTLEIAIDKKGGVSLEDCSKVTKVIEPLIDRLNPIEESYYLMVSSAGSERVLRTAAHIEAAKEHSVIVILKLFTSFEGKKEYEGSIADATPDSITITQRDTDSEITLPRKLISKMSAMFTAG